MIISRVLFQESAFALNNIGQSSSQSTTPLSKQVGDGDEAKTYAKIIESFDVVIDYVPIFLEILCFDTFSKL